ncbi:biotin/lipoyl-containing protein [Isobaculum melis]|uniref:Biotin-requiring enzyme n=1 Tax=Isobaculum melis TaxID=142588 RepID=A0A1H9TLC0_9LACT|nr:biotin/lipoyl-containing protein [Isobaculum melis]SER97837.1 Biotin-requiring enzyme [Isobaculum melis]
MKTYEINVNGKVYQVGVKEIDEATYKNHTQQAETVSAPAATAAPVTGGSGATVSAPMPGVLLKIAVNVGDQVKAGQLLCLLEAMKMENEIVAPEDGVVSAIHVKQGEQVEAGAVLITL